MVRGVWNGLVRHCALGRRVAHNVCINMVNCGMEHNEFGSALCNGDGNGGRPVCNTLLRPTQPALLDQL